MKTLLYALAGMMFLGASIVGFGRLALENISASHRPVRTQQPPEEGFLPLLSLEESQLAPDITAEPALEATLAADATAASSQAAGQSATPKVKLIPTPTAPPLIPDRIGIPAIELDAPIIEAQLEELELEGKTYRQWLAPDEYAVGWHPDSATLGRIGNTVLNGHHNIHGKVFEKLDQLRAGDRFTLYSGSYYREYIVTNVMIAAERWMDLQTRLDNARWIQPSDDERVTIITCWPPWSNTHRLIIVARPVLENERVD